MSSSRRSGSERGPGGGCWELPEPLDEQQRIENSRRANPYCMRTRRCCNAGEVILDAKDVDSDDAD